MLEDQIQQWLKQNVDRSIARPTRTHALPSDPEGSLFVKREDELSSGISGSKLRKYASLIPFLKDQGIERVAIVGGPNSNNVVGLLQTLREAKIRPYLFLREAADPKKRGNALFLDMLAPAGSIHSVARSDWENVESQAAAFLAKSKTPSYLIPEGALCPESLPGCITLAQDLLRNETSGPFFENIYMDSGTGMNAIGLLLGLALLDPKRKERRIHITLIAGDEEQFAKNLKQFKKSLLPCLEIEKIELPNFDFLHPPISKKFGSTNTSLIQACRQIAKEEGLLMDPTYSVKHYMAMKQHRSKESPRGNSLFVFNGSALGLSGFQEQLEGQTS